jgi:hypothetical protein
MQKGSPRRYGLRDDVNDVVATAFCRRVAINSALTERGDYSAASSNITRDLPLAGLRMFPTLERLWRYRFSLCISE